MLQAARYLLGSPGASGFGSKSTADDHVLSSRVQAAATACYAAVHPRLAGVSCRYLADCNEALPSPAAASRTKAARLWQASEDMITGSSQYSIEKHHKDRNI